MIRTTRFLWFDNPLAMRLVIASLIVGSVLSIFSTGLQLATSYSRQRADAEDVLDRINDTLTISLERAVWTFNFAQVDILLDGLTADPNIAYLSLETTTGQNWSRGDDTALDSVAQVGRQYDLTHVFGTGRTEVVGQLNVWVSLENVWANVMAQFWTTLLTNLAKAYLAAFALHFLVHRMISRHLRHIVDHVQTQDPQANRKLVLNRPPRARRDDIDDITSAIDAYEHRTQEQMSALNHEITVRERAESEAREALSVRSRFLATMSHEIRTPLNSIMGFLHLIATNPSTKGKPLIYAETASKAAHQLLGLMNNSLDMSRIEAGAIEVQPVDTDLRKLAGTWYEVSEGLRHMREKTFEIVLEIDDDVPERVEIDASIVTQIVSNLCDNATKFTEDGRVAITISATLGQDDTASIDIRVRDTGSGIPEEAHERIFQRFSQAENGMLRTHGGSGLGLAICRELAVLIGAKLELELSDKDGFNTTFLLQLNGVSVVDHK